MHAFQNPDCDLTLAEGLEEYYSSNPDLKRGEALSPSAREFFRCHDAAHAVFGCDTSLANEAVVKLSSLFGTTGGLSVLRGYALYDSLDIYRKLPLAEVLATICASVLIVPRTLVLRARQRKPWPWAAFDGFLGAPLVEIRREFGIRI
jgi:hypothetical protein